ncbi:uncharacterized protein LOC127726253 [Mytilus californianus]|uniref:uncharacterized protein LOC127726253 n=1 Tax=Mytilus californianus TaxID=6549 RepID=UPI0022479ED9|nr:uncharacterized protein LOC127726253 [Mytilus californianus]
MGRYQTTAFIGSLCCLLLVIHALPTTRSPLLTSIHLTDQNCTDCCEFLQCTEKFTGKINISNSGIQFIEAACNDMGNLQMLSCYTPEKLQSCSYLKRMSSYLPAQQTMKEQLTEMCAHKDDFLGLESCTAAKSFVDSYSICTDPYVAALSDKTADLCQVYKVQVNCTITLLTTTNCNSVYVNTYRSIQEKELTQTCELLKYVQSVIG